MSLAVAGSTGARAQTTLNVDVANVLNDVSNKPIGINLNYLMDGSYISPAPTTSTTTALQNMGVKFLRFPGGEKADNYLWSIPPFAGPNPRFARTGSCEWPSNDPRFAYADYSTVRPVGLDFDEFMTMSQTVGGEPLIVVAYDAMYKSANCGTVPTKSQLIQTAVEWVRYANIVKNYNVRYWMIGNESWKSCDYNGCATAAQYRDDIIQFSQAMKAVDPTIKIIANGETNSWWATVLPAAAPHIDYLGLSNYPVWQYTGGYSYYQNNAPNLMGVVNTATNALNSYCSPADKSRIKIISTEYNSKDWQGSWADGNDLGHALASFEILGEHLKNPKVEAAMMWNTRWVNNTTNPNDIFDAIDRNGNLLPQGKVLSIWGKNLLTKMVSASSTTTVRNYATYNPTTQDLTVFLVNKATSQASVVLNVLNYIPFSSIEHWEYKGMGPAETNPGWTRSANKTLNGAKKSLTLPPVSITMLKLRKRTLSVINLLTLTKDNPTTGNARLSWTTDTEETEGAYIVERSTDGKTFFQIGKVKHNGSKSYSYVDEEPLEAEAAYYRVKSEDGGDDASEVVKFTREIRMSDYSFYPNPATSHVTIEVLPKLDIPVEVKAYSADGKLAYSRRYEPEDPDIRVDVETWAKGVYILQVKAGPKILSKKLLVQ